MSMSKIFFSFWAVSASIIHIWTLIIAYQVSGLLATILSFIFPVIAEIYWIINQWSTHRIYVLVALFHIVGGIVIYFFARRR